MSCQNPTSPNDIVINKNNTCSQYCVFNFDYKITSVNVRNRGKYLLYTFDDQTRPVKFNNHNYKVVSMRIYRPSLHTYNNKPAHAEILIIHNQQIENNNYNVSTNNKLIVCVPIIEGSNSESILDVLIKQTSTIANNKNNEISSLYIPEFTLNTLVKNKPFYFYKGTLPYEPCGGSINYIVYDINNSLNIQNDSYKKLQKIISKHNITSIKNNGDNIFYNENGPNNNNLGNDIYIDCEPTGDNGEILISKSINFPSVNPLIGEYLSFSLLIVIIVIVLYYVIKFLKNKISGVFELKKNNSCNGIDCLNN